MSFIHPKGIGQHLEIALRRARLTQSALAKATGIHRVQIVRMIAGQVVPRLDEAERIASVLKVPIEWFLTGRTEPTTDLRGIAIELNNLGVWDLEVSEQRVPGSFRYAEEIVVLAVSGKRPEPRVVEAIPYVLAIRQLRPVCLDAFATVHDTSAPTRLAWLCEIALALSRQRSFPVEIRHEEQLHAIISRGKKSQELDSLGHPGTGPRSSIWRRWNITYAGTIDDFLRRAIEVHASLFESGRMLRGDGP